MIRALIHTAARHFGFADVTAARRFLSLSDRTVAPAKSPIAARPLPFHQNAPSAIAMTPLTLHLPSPLIGETDPATADALNAIYRAADVQVAAMAHMNVLVRLAEVAGQSAAVAGAIASICQAGGDLSPEAAAREIAAMTERIEAEINAARTDQLDHGRAEKVALERHRPLREAVSVRLTKLSNERHHLDAEIDSIRRAAGMGFTSGRYATLSAMGLSEQAIAAADPGVMSPDATIAVKQERMREIAGIVPRLNAFAANPVFDAAPIIGLDPALDALIVARDGQLQTEAAQ